MATVIIGGFEGLGDPELDTQHVSPNTMRTFNSSKFKEKDEELLSLALFNDQNESLSTNSSATPPRLNPDINGVPIPNPPGCKTAEPSTSNRPYFGSFNWYSPTSSPITPAGTPYESPTTSEVTKRVTFNDNEEVKEISLTTELNEE